MDFFLLFFEELQAAQVRTDGSCGPAILRPLLWKLRDAWGGRYKRDSELECLHRGFSDILLVLLSGALLEGFSSDLSLSLEESSTPNTLARP